MKEALIDWFIVNLGGEGKQAIYRICDFYGADSGTKRWSDCGGPGDSGC